MTIQPVKPAKKKWYIIDNQESKKAGEAVKGYKKSWSTRNTREMDEAYIDTESKCDDRKLMRIGKKWTRQVRISFN